MDRIINIETIHKNNLDILENIIKIYINNPTILENDYKKPIFLTENIDYIKEFRQNIIDVVSNYIKSKITI
jgi:hypothetical protein